MYDAWQLQVQTGACMSDEFEPSPYQPEEAFAAGQSHAGQTFAGQPLRAFSYSRKLAAQSMGCIAPGVIDFAEHMRSKGTYPGALSDTIIVTWLCTLRDNSEMDAEGIRAGEWTPERARNGRVMRRPPPTNGRRQTRSITFLPATAWRRGSFSLASCSPSMPACSRSGPKATERRRWRIRRPQKRCPAIRRSDLPLAGRTDRRGKRQLCPRKDELRGSAPLPHDFLAGTR